MKYQLLIVALLVVLLVTAGGWTNATNITGTWEITVERSAVMRAGFARIISFYGEMDKNGTANGIGYLEGHGGMGLTLAIS